MIGFMPEIYPDELVYSWLARCYAHSGYPAYVFALEDLMGRKNARPDVELMGKFSKNVQDIISLMMPMEELILKHTMFPYYRFTGTVRLSHALQLMAESQGNACQLLQRIEKERCRGSKQVGGLAGDDGAVMKL